MKLNKIVRISLSGGIIGAIFTNPRKALDDILLKNNRDGWNAHQIMSHKSSNEFILLIQIIVLIMTLGLWTWGSGYFILFEKESQLLNNKKIKGD